MRTTLSVCIYNSISNCKFMATPHYIHSSMADPVLLSPSNYMAVNLPLNIDLCIPRVLADRICVKIKCMEIITDIVCISILVFFLSAPK